MFLNKSTSITCFYQNFFMNQRIVTKNNLKMYHQLPINVLNEKCRLWSLPIESQEYARRLDEEDQFKTFRQLFSFPKKKDLPFIDLKRLFDENEECIYLCGQSLGLKPKSIDHYVKEVLNNWAQKGVHSHFHGHLPAALSDLPAKMPMARLVGALQHEVTIMNALTVNLHLLLATFYRPTNRRYKIMIEEHAFSSDMYVVKSQIRFHGYSPEASLVLLKPRRGEHLLRQEDIIDVIDSEGDQISVALFPAVQYYTGQLLDIKTLTQVAQERGIMVGVDLAHAVGNVPIYLHTWNVDFAAWCTYKYLNSGAGGIGGIYVHERHTEKGGNTQMPMLQGWWGNNIKTKFLMKDDFDPCAGTDMFKLSNPSPILNAMLMSSLDIYSQTSMEELKKKQFILTGYLEFMIKTFFPQRIKNGYHSNGMENTRNGNTELYEHTDTMPCVEILTPSDPEQRGAQLSLVFSVPLTAVQEELQKRGVVCDIRMPNVLRVAPVPLYNSFIDVHKFVTTLYEIFQQFSSNGENGNIYEFNNNITKQK